jgi:hypothetical protein
MNKQDNFDLLCNIRLPHSPRDQFLGKPAANQTCRTILAFELPSEVPQVDL